MAQCLKLQAATKRKAQDKDKDCGKGPQTDPPRCSYLVAENLAIEPSSETVNIRHHMGRGLTTENLNLESLIEAINNSEGVYHRYENLTNLTEVRKGGTCSPALFIFWICLFLSFWPLFLPHLPTQKPPKLELSLHLMNQNFSFQKFPELGSIAARSCQADAKAKATPSKKQKVVEAGNGHIQFHPATIHTVIMCCYTVLMLWEAFDNI